MDYLKRVSDNVLAGIDFMKEYVEGIKDNNYESLEADDIVEKIKEAISTIKEGGQAETKTNLEKIVDESPNSEEFVGKYETIGGSNDEVEMEDMGKGKNLAEIDEITAAKEKEVTTL